MTPTAALLLRWYDAHRRTLPWREVANPYATWVSETMLQQTRVETVLGYYQRFLQRFPTLTALAEAEEEEVLKLWEGLGYYSRARNLLKGARQVVAEYGGTLPREPEALRRIAGIGPYTAGAIASIAYGLPVPAVDGNVIRVISRLRGIRENIGIPSVRRQLEAETASLIPAERPGDFNQALMDLGSGICTPGTPDCDRCPLASLCDACSAEDAADLPLLPRKNPPREEPYALLLLYTEEGVLPYQRREKLLQGLWCFPMLPGTFTPPSLRQAVQRQWGISPLHLKKVGEARHVFTHRVWRMTLYTAEIHQKTAGFLPADAAQLQSLPLPTAVKAARALALDYLSARVPPMSK